jgi:hypothetical protein
MRARDALALDADPVASCVPPDAAAAAPRNDGLRRRRDAIRAKGQEPPRTRVEPQVR